MFKKIGNFFKEMFEVGKKGYKTYNNLPDDKKESITELANKIAKGIK